MERIRLALVVLLLLAVPACGDGSANDEEATATIPATVSPTGAAPSASTEPTATTTSEPSFPPARQDLTHGDDTWVVILAASEDSDDPVLSTAVDDAEAAGYQTGPTDCDAGAAEVLGLPEDRHYYTVSVYFSNEADAEAAHDAFAARGVDGTVGVVQTFCLD